MAKIKTTPPSGHTLLRSPSAPGGFSKVGRAAAAGAQTRLNTGAIGSPQRATQSLLGGIRNRQQARSTRSTIQPQQFQPSNIDEAILGRPFNSMSIADRQGLSIDEALRFASEAGVPIPQEFLDDSTLADPATVAAGNQFRLTNADISRANALGIPLGELLQSPNPSQFLDNIENPVAPAPQFDQEFIDTISGPLFDQIGTLTQQVEDLQGQLDDGGKSDIVNQLLFALFGGGQQDEEGGNQFTGGSFFPSGSSPFLAA